MNWQELVQHLCSRYPGTHDGRTWVRLHWRSAQQIIALSSEVAGLPQVTFVALIGSEASLSCTEALLWNGRLLAGALLLRDGVYLFRVSIPTRALTIAELEAVVEFTGSEATRMREYSQPRRVEPHDGEAGLFSWTTQ